MQEGGEVVTGRPSFENYQVYYLVPESLFTRSDSLCLFGFVFLISMSGCSGTNSVSKILSKQLKHFLPESKRGMPLKLTMQPACFSSPLQVLLGSGRPRPVLAICQALGTLDPHLLCSLVVQLPLLGGGNHGDI